MGIQNRFASDDPYVLSALTATARNNQADLQVVVRETDHLRATSVYFQAQGLTNTAANPVSNAALVAQQTIGNSVGEGGGVEPPTCPEISQWILVERNSVAVPIRVESLTLKDFPYNPITQGFEELIKADIIEDSILWEVIAHNGAKGVGSPSHPLIEGTWDIKGTPLEKVKLNQHAMSVVELSAEYTRIKNVVRKRNKGTVRHLSTIGPSHIYAAGTRADQMLVWHNRKRED